jgi:hypothetical protein
MTTPSEVTIGQKVEFQTDRVDFGVGSVVSYDENTGQVVVRDDEDGALWTGDVDLTIPVEAA